jgi:hypothetical protein
LTELSKLQWVFKKTSGISDVSTLKPKIIEALSSDAGKTAIKNTLTLDRVKTLFPKDILIDADNYIDRLIINMGKDDIFNTVFKVVE